MRTIRLIASNTFRQTVRQKIFYNILLFGVGMIIFAMVVSNITFGYSDRVVRSIGLSGISIAIDLLALLTGVGLVHTEIDRKSLYVVLTRPVQRWQYVAGRLLGLIGTLVLITVGLTIMFWAVLIAARGTPNPQDAVAILASFGEASILAAVGIAFSCFTTPTLGAGMGLGVWIVAATTDDLIGLTANQPGVKSLAQIISYIFPSFARLNFREEAVYMLSVSFSEVAMALLYAAIYTLVVASIASGILSRRELV